MAAELTDIFLLLFAFSALTLLVGRQKGIRPVKTEWWGAGLVICLGRGPDLHMDELMPLPLTVSCSSRSRMVLPFWYRLIQVVPDTGPLNRCSSSSTVFSTSTSKMHIRCT